MVPRISLLPRFICVIWALPVLLQVASGCGQPRDLVRVEVEGLPEQPRFICVVANGERDPLAMRWYYRKGSWEEISTAINWTFVLMDLRSSGTHRLGEPVRWIDGRRYGLLIRREDQSWRVWWWDADGFELKERSWLWGGGTAVFAIGTADAVENPTVEEVKRWGVDVDYLDKYAEPEIKRRREEREREVK